MSAKSKRKLNNIGPGFMVSLLTIFMMLNCVVGEVNFDLPPYQDPAGDVIEFNETWSNVGFAEGQDQLDIKWLESKNDTLGNVVLTMDLKGKNKIEISNQTKYVFRISTSQDNSTGYNITFINGTTKITNLNGTIEDDITINTSTTDDGEVLKVEISKIKYLSNITYYYIDAYTWKEEWNRTFIDYVYEIPGHPGEISPVIDGEDGDGGDGGGDKGDDGACLLPLILIAVIIIIVVIILLIYLKNRV
ncbi:MAG: hypothetical protein JSW00_13385 [Thermoplasmata archaeon]|nr:MAG: hypothetical protein JSW00_13385 [Thermoplasmata archaeon]